MTNVAMPHPAHRAVHAVRNALQIAIGMRDVPGDDGGSLEEDGARIVELLEHVPVDIAELYHTTEQLQSDLRGLRDLGIADAREITRLRQALAHEQQEREALVIALTEALGSLSEVHRQANRLRLDGARRDVPPTDITHEPPRIAAVGA